jgi:hypothetical protein
MKKIPLGTQPISLVPFYAKGKRILKKKKKKIIFFLPSQRFRILRSPHRNLRTQQKTFIRQRKLHKIDYGSERVSPRSVP